MVYIDERCPVCPHCGFEKMTQTRDGYECPKCETGYILTELLNKK